MHVLDLTTTVTFTCCIHKFPPFRQHVDGSLIDSGVPLQKCPSFAVCSPRFSLLSFTGWPLCWRLALQWKEVLAQPFDMVPAVSCPPLTCPLLFDPQDCSSSEEYTVAAALLPLSTAFYRVRISLYKRFACFSKKMYPVKLALYHNSHNNKTCGCCVCDFKCYTSKGNILAMN